MSAMTVALDVLSWIMLTVGGAFVFIGGLGALRMPNLYTRMHAASLTDTMAAVLIIGGIMLQAGLTLATIKLATIPTYFLVSATECATCPAGQTQNRSRTASRCQKHKRLGQVFLRQTR